MLQKNPFLIILLLLSCIVSADMEGVNSRAGKLVNNILVSESDDRDYLATTLPNGLKALFISDPTTEMAAAAIGCGVGSLDDEEDLPGQAHFTEHLLFMGSTAFPDENEYSSFLSDHGGSSNAYTASDLTNYHFEVAPEHLSETLNRFAGFFTGPLLKESAVARELLAVDAEHAKNIQSDMWRQFQLDKSTSDVGHPYAKFGTGDSRTLRDTPKAQGVNVRERIVAFHSKYYSASTMALVILGREPVATLREWAIEKFVAIPNNGMVPRTQASHPYTRCSGVQQWMLPVKDTRSVSVTWPLPDTRAHFQSKSDSYLSHLIGHEGPGSALSHFKARGWATGLSAGTNDAEHGYSLFSVTVHLTAEGLQCTDEVLAVLYAYIGMLRARGPQSWVWDEVATQAASSFRFQNKHGAFSTVMSAVKGVLDYEPRLCLSADSLYTAYDADEISRFLSLMTPQNSRVRTLAKAVADKCDKSEPWYGTSYGQAPLSQAQLVSWNRALTSYAAFAESSPATATAAAAVSVVEVGSDAWAAALSPGLHLPAPNDFIATDFELRHTALRAKQAAGADAAPAPTPALGPREPVPVQLRSDNRSTVWWHLDDHFGIPKAYVKAQVELPAGYTSPRAIVLLDLYVRLLKESLNEFAYAADIAGLTYRADAVIKGVTITVGGFSHKLSVLAGKIGGRMVDMVSAFTDLQFDMQKDAAQRSYANFNLEAPYQHAMYAASVTLNTPKWHNDEKMAVIGSITAAELRAFVPELLRNCFARALVVGNADAKEALAAVDALIAPLMSASQPVPPSMRMRSRTVALPAALHIPGAAAASGIRGVVSLTAHAASAVFSRIRALGPNHSEASAADGAAAAAASTAALAAADITVSFEWVHRQPARNPADANAALLAVMLVGPQTSGPRCSQNVLVGLLAHVLSEPFFDTLRTKQSLGYLVSAGSTETEGGVLGLRFIVQSNKVDAPELVVRMETFLAEFGATLASMPEDKFRDNIAAVVSQKMEGPKNLIEETDALWGEIVSGTLDFKRSSHEIAALRVLSHRDLVEFFVAYVTAGGVGRRTFLSLVDPGTEAPAPGSGAAAPDDEEEGEDDDDEEGEEEAVTPAVGATLSAAQSGSSITREDLIAPDPNAPPSEVEPASPITPIAATLLALLPHQSRTVVALNLTASQALHIQRAASAHGFALSRSREDAFAAVLGFFEDAGVPIADRIRAATSSSGNGSAFVVRCSVAVPTCDSLRGSLAFFPTPETPAQL